MRKNGEIEFNIVFKRVKTFCKNSTINMSLYRRVSKLVYRNNTPVTMFEKYSIFG